MCNAPCVMPTVYSAQLYMVHGCSVQSDTRDPTTRTTHLPNIFATLATQTLGGNH